MKNKYWISILLAFIFLTPTINISFSGTRDPTVSDHKYIEYGKKFQCVGKLCGKYKDSTMFCASAVAIDDHHILTAAHVVKDSLSCFLYINDREFCIDSVTIHKDFEEEFGLADIAIGYSEKSFELDFYPELYSKNDEVGQLCSISGYGYHGTFNSGAKYHDDKKRAGSNIIEDIQKNMLICSPSRLGSKDRTSLEFLIASGDSGGGLFLNNQLAGINSCIMSIDKAPSAKYNDESGHTRISVFVSWINQNRKQ